MYEYETWSVTLNEKIRLITYRRKAIKKMFGLNKNASRQENGVKFITRSFMSFTPHHILFADEVLEDDFAGACGKCERDEKCLIGSGLENKKKEII